MNTLLTAICRTGDKMKCINTPGQALDPGRCSGLFRSKLRCISPFVLYARSETGPSRRSASLTRLRMRKLLALFILIASLPLSALDFGLLLQADYFGDLEPTTPYENLRSRLYARPELSGDFLAGTVDFYLSANLFTSPWGRIPSSDPTTF